MSFVAIAIKSLFALWGGLLLLALLAQLIGAALSRWREQTSALKQGCVNCRHRSFTWRYWPVSEHSHRYCDRHDMHAVRAISPDGNQCGVNFRSWQRRPHPCASLRRLAGFAASPSDDA